MAPTATSATPGAAASTSTAPAVASSSSSTTPAPSTLEEATQRYQSTKLALRTGLANKRLIDRSLIDLESQIYLFEGSYLQSTSSSGGNIVKGFDSYLKNSSTTSSSRGSNAAGALGEIPIEDRIFSLSSATYAKSLELKANEGAEPEERESSVPPKAKDETPVVKKKKDVAATPVAASGKKKKDAADKKEKERSSTPNLKSTGGKAEGGSAGGTPTKTGTGGKAASATGAGTATKLKRKLTDGGAASGAGSTPSGKAHKRKKDDD